MYRILQTGFTTNYGGVESVVMNWFRNIDRSKFMFDFLVKHDSPKIAYEDEIIRLGGHVYRSYYGRKEKPLQTKKYLNDIFDNDRSIVGVHMNVNSMEYITPLILAEKRKLPIKIIHSHNSGNINKRVQIETRMMQKINVLKISSNKYQKFGCSNEALQYMFGNTNGTVIHNAIDLGKFKFNECSRVSLRNSYKINANSTVIGFVGRLQYQKFPEKVIEIFSEYLKINPDSYLIMIGDGNLREICKKIIYEKKISERVILTGMKNDTSDFYSMFDLLLLPSRFEGLPVVLLEAQATGLPCLVSENITKEAFVTRLIHQNLLGLSNHNWAVNIDDILKEKINRNSSEFREEISSNGYNIKLEIKKLESLYLKLIEGYL